jgi:hypothetical protein
MVGWQPAAFGVFRHTASASTPRGTNGNGKTSQKWLAPSRFLAS